MDYDEKYNKALKQARDYHSRCTTDYARREIEAIFPELKESKDERIRNEIIAFIKQALHSGGGTIVPQEKEDKWIAWLEKQKEQKPSWTEIDKSRESVFFSFNARVKDSDKVVTIIDGQLNSDGKLWIRFASNEYDGFKVYNPEDLLVEQKPAEWSEEDEKRINWVIKHFRQGVGLYDNLIYWLTQLPQRFNLQPRQEWSKEEMGVLIDCVSALQNSGHWILADKLSSLRPHPKAEWSEKDEERYNSCLQRLGTGNPDQPETINSKWFKEHVTSQPHWKPSEEQIRPLEYAIEYFKKKKNDTTYLESLLNDLNKL